MERMVRKQLYITSEHESKLKSKSSETGVSEGEIVREALSRYLDSSIPRKQGLSNWEDEMAFIKSLQAKGPVPGGRTWKREELYDRPRTD
ncbi:MAG: hypothetical protein HPY55_00820 [Firmicutes bacterium]|nr:hypothetical protein [Bacillota bacterium]